ncbi:phosphorylase b kinase regulatory subunit beta-like [Myxocyprinus asiaticus]|uniref:phosphorylase b kinase regulatory subunit beta-like n=1 Tax=Myxocyprinus asiaticus TaxID=70543 RepID=UPI002221EE56|nr:phosphorylase b kinase regulatory subunit beta-like [Myxocyprinus asiaticus]
MKHELKIRARDMPTQDIYKMSPSDVRQLLLDVLQPQQTGRSWLNRCQIDGSLNHTPLGFYDRVWQILERTRNGIMVGGHHLPQDDMEVFSNTPALRKQRTSSYLTKAVMIQLLQGEVKPSKDDPCSVS